MIVAWAYRGAGDSIVHAGTFFVGGDPIGTTSDATDNTGGFTAVENANQNFGEPAVEIALTGQEVLKQFRVIVFGLPSHTGNLHFSDFDYQLEFWKSSNYFNNAAAEFVVDLGEPMGVDLTPAGPSSIVPNQPFGTTGPLASDAVTYDFHFDLSSLPGGNPAQQILDSPLQAGDWVIAFQSRHDVDDDGYLRVAAAKSAAGPIPLFSRDGVAERGILGGQNPDNILLSWGIAVMADGIVPGDFDANDLIDGNDLAVWTSAFGNSSAADADGDGISGGSDFLQWQRGMNANSGGQSLATVPEPAALFLAMETMLLWSTRRRRRSYGAAEGH